MKSKHGRYQIVCIHRGPKHLGGIEVVCSMAYRDNIDCAAESEGSYSFRSYAWDTESQEIVCETPYKPRVS